MYCMWHRRDEKNYGGFPPAIPEKGDQLGVSSNVSFLLSFIKLLNFLGFSEK